MTVMVLFMNCLFLTFSAILLLQRQACASDLVAQLMFPGGIIYEESDGIIKACVVISEPPAGEVMVSLTTVDGSAKAPDDFEAVSATVKFRSDSDTIQCIDIKLEEDEVAETIETFDVILTSVDVFITPPSTVTILIRDSGKFLIIGFEESTYTTDEQGPATVCIVIVAGTAERPVEFTIKTEDGSASAATDYVTPFPTFKFDPGQTRICANIAILDDNLVEGTEDFIIALDSLDGTTGPATVIIRDNDEFTLVFTSDTPAVEGNQVTIAFVSNIALDSATCTIDVAAQVPQDCADGTAVFSNLPPNRRRRYEITIEATSSLSVENAVLTRDFRSDTAGVCSAHLINEGVSVIDGKVTFEWEGTGPLQNPMEPFICLLDDVVIGKCTPPFVLNDVDPGPHLLIIRPPRDPDCDRRVGRRVDFNV